jgi:hypothetical protein
VHLLCERQIKKPVRSFDRHQLCIGLLVEKSLFTAIRYLESFQDFFFVPWTKSSRETRVADALIVGIFS